MQIGSVKHVVGISLGDSKRDFNETIELLGVTVNLRRIGTDGDLSRYVELLKEYDGKCDAIGFGGFDLYLWCAGKRYIWRQPQRFLSHVTHTPVLDGSGLKNSLERSTILFLAKEGIVDFRRSNSLLVCAVDRFGMAEALSQQGGPVIFGDLMFSLDLPIPIRTLGTLQIVAKAALPLIVRLPIKWLYPTGSKQREIIPKFAKYYAWADNICGDTHYIKRHMPADLSGKVIITNTTTPEDIESFRSRGVRLLVTTTPSLAGRSPGTNMFEAAIVAALGKNPTTLTPVDYEDALHKIGWKPNIIEL